MLEKYFKKPTTIDRIQQSWLAGPINQYVVWLSEREFSSRTIIRRVPLLIRFGEFAKARGARRGHDLGNHVDAFVRRELRRRARPCRSSQARRVFANDLRRPIMQMVRVATRRLRKKSKREPFFRQVPGFFAYLREERGLKAPTVSLYQHHLSRFEQFLSKRRNKRLNAISPTVLDAFIHESSQSNSPQSLRGVCSALRVFLRYAFREACMPSDLSGALEGPRCYRLSEIPRCVPWDEVIRTIEGIDRRSAVGKRDYAIVLLLAVYGLRAREVACLNLKDIDWRSNTLHVRGRKAGHSSAYPLSQAVGDSILDYLKNGRPVTADSRIFITDRAPRRPLGHAVISNRAGFYLKAAGVVAPRLGSHTLRHSVAQRMVDSDFSLKVVGDYLGHRSPASTMIYSKISIDSLRDLALGDGEDIL